MVGAILGGVILIGGVVGDAEAQPAPPPLCASSGPAPDLSDAQAQNARTLVAVASTRGGEQPALISLMVPVDGARFVRGAFATSRPHAEQRCGQHHETEGQTGERDGGDGREGTRAGDAEQGEKRRCTADRAGGGSGAEQVTSLIVVLTHPCFG